MGRAHVGDVFSYLWLSFPLPLIPEVLLGTGSLIGSYSTCIVLSIDGVIPETS